MKVSLPGIGGSLGECIYCGESFAVEVMTGRSVPVIGIDGFGDTSLPIHQKCKDAMQGLVDKGCDWTALPDGPLRKEYEQAFNSTEVTA